MNILVISHYAGSPEMGMVFRPYYFAKEWIKLNHSTTVMAASFTHIRKTNPEVVADFDESIIDCVKYVWIKTPRYADLFQRGINILSFVFKLLLNAKKIAEKYKPDIVIASSTYNFEIYAAVKIAKYAHAKLIYEVRDLWPLTPIELGHYSKYNPVILLMNRAERFAYKKSDFVISVLPCVHEYMRTRGLNLNKLIIIPNGVFKDDWSDNNVEAITDKDLLSVLQKERAAGHLIVGFAGAFNQANALEYLLDAAYILKDKQICFILVGNGTDKQYLQIYAQSKGLRNVFFFNYISKKQIPDLLQYFDIAYIGWRKLDIYRFGISPNKLMDYMMSARPVIHAVVANNDPIRESGGGITVDAENSRAIADGILELAALSQAERDAIGKRGREYILKNQTYDILAKQFLDFVTEK